MAIFNRNNGKESANLGSTTIANGTIFNGEINTECSVHIDGKIDGSIISNNLITIGKTGLVQGNIIANKVIISGLFIGDLKANEVQILDGGDLKGKIISKSLIISVGGNFEGESQKIKDEEVNFIEEDISA